MRSIRVRYRTERRAFEFDNPCGELVGISAAPGRPTACSHLAPCTSAGAAPRGVVGTMLGAGTLIGYLSRAAHETGIRLVILTVLSESGEQVAAPLLSELLEDEEAGLIMQAAASTDDPVSTLRRFLTFRPDRGALSAL